MRDRNRKAVSCFIVLDHKILLLKRSDKVHSYPNHWGTISGSIEPTDSTPLSRAWKELYETTTLGPQELKLVLSQGPLLKFTDPDGIDDTHWCVYPFLFHLGSCGDVEKIRLNWEHTEFVWVSPDELLGFSSAAAGGGGGCVKKKGGYKTVPRLGIALGRVWISKELEEGLRGLREDHVSGARELALKGLEILKSALGWIAFGGGSGEEGEEEVESVWERLLVVGWHVAKDGREAMGAAIEGAILSALDEIQPMWKSGSKEADLIHSIKIINSHISHEKTALDDLYAHFIKTMEAVPNGDKDVQILTLSNSSTVYQALLKLLSPRSASSSSSSTINDTHHYILNILESRPLFEGVTLAKRLLENLPAATNPSLKSIHLAPDACVGHYASTATHVLLGADKIYADGTVSNKSGSLAAAVLAKRRFDDDNGDGDTKPGPKPKVIVVSQTAKIVLDKYDPSKHRAENNDPKEVTNTWPDELGWKGMLEDERLSVDNFYFEVVPKEMVDLYVTEVGVLTAEGVEKLARRRRGLEKRVFGRFE